MRLLVNTRELINNKYMTNIFDRLKNLKNKNTAEWELCQSYVLEQFLKQELKNLIKKTVGKNSYGGYGTKEAFAFQNGCNRKRDELIQTYRDIGLGELVDEIIK